MTNKWESIWKGKSPNISVNDNVFDSFVQLKRANGFDVLADGEYYQNFYSEFKQMVARINDNCGTFESVYEIGCGSGVNLYLFNRLFSIEKLGGLDYSESLLKIAKEVVQSDDLRCIDASSIDVKNKYDIILADSVFQYFTDAEKGYDIINKMCQKANKAVVVTEIHDEEFRKEHISFRRSMIENYDKLYSGLDKTYYNKETLIKYAKDRGYTCIIHKPLNDNYWNSRFVFDYYLIK
ncbi:Methylase involved in ubiquinone/menaquinone biosynthesis [Butyrivibrio fibrisolvens 16/4]|nr:Methylase involved in ubiquinone/menaquinone biosynthesis [Butyrivibrio fibrisolvens 16/4]